jgi:hypothetical protein
VLAKNGGGISPSAGDECASGKFAYAVGKAVLIDEPPANEAGRGAAAADAEVHSGIVPFLYQMN